MEKVKDLILYQVATDRNYKVGDKITFDKNTKNGQYQRVMNSVAVADNKRVCDKLYKISKSHFAKLKKDQIFEVARYLDDYDVVLRDLALENVRKEFYPDYPSRLSSMYLSETKEDAIKNLKQMVAQKGVLYQAVAVKLNGKIHRVGADGAISRLGQSYAYYYEKAKSYWSHKCLKGQAMEILFEGEAEIVEIIKEIKL